MMIGIEKMLRKRLFEKISIIGRVAYSSYCLELFLKQENYNLEKWELLMDALWSFSDMEAVDDYAYKIIECTPETVLDERENFKTFDYFTEEELLFLKELYQSCSDVDVVNYIMEEINEILAFNLYTSSLPPERFSLDIMEKNLYPYMQSKIKNMPQLEPFELYSIKDCECWGIFHSRNEIGI